MRTIGVIGGEQEGRADAPTAPYARWRPTARTSLGLLPRPGSSVLVEIVRKLDLLAASSCMLATHDDEGRQIGS
jgi:hypothetical protein